jgi:hypothetical protein
MSRRLLSTSYLVHFSPNLTFNSILSELLIMSSNKLWIYVQDVPGGKVNILGCHSVCHSKQYIYIYIYIYIYMCPIANGFERVLLHCTIVRIWRPILFFSPACESVWSVSWPLWLLIVTLQECCGKCRTSSQIPNMLIWCMLSSHDLQSA